MDLTTYNFTVEATCPICFPVAITGHFTFDADTDSIVGPWSFSAFGENFMSSTDPGSYAQVFSPVLVFVDPDTNFAGSDFSVVLFSVPPFLGDVGGITGINSCEVGCELVASPEAPSMVLLGSGMLGLALLGMRKNGRRRAATLPARAK